MKKVNRKDRDFIEDAMLLYNMYKDGTLRHFFDRKDHRVF